MERMTRLRAGTLLAALALVLCFFAFRLYAMQIIDREENSNNITLYTTYTTVRAARGEILDANGNKLVSNRASYNLEFNHYTILNSGKVNDSLLKLVKLCREQGIAYTDHFPVTVEQPFTYTLADYNSAWKGYFQKFLVNRGGIDSDISAELLIKTLRKSYKIPAEWSDEDARLVLGLRYELTLRNSVTNLPNYIFIEDVSKDDMATIMELAVPGLKVETSTVREYHTKYAAHVLGYIGKMNSTQMEHYTQLGYPRDALVGQSGFELAFEDYLHATDGIRVDKTTKDGTVVDSYYKVEPKAGSNVEVSIDLMMQMAAEDALAETIEQWRNAGEDEKGSDVQGGAAVAIDIKTGQVLVSASYPTYDPAKLLAEYNQITAQPYTPLLNRPLMATYPPGSTYKMSMVVTGIHEGAITIDEKIRDLGVYRKYPGFTANCLQWTNYHSTHSYINCTNALRVSCNYFFYELADRLSIDAIDATAKGFGLGEKTGVELYEYVGNRANKETKASLFAGTTDAGWYPADQIMTGIGQSFNAFTPMQLAVYTSTLANRGTRYKATFLNKVVSADYSQLLYENKAEILSTMEISDEAYEAYTKGMYMVANQSGGTAYTAFKNYPIDIAAKTGTAQVVGGSSNGAFVCYAPADDPQIAVVVYGERIGGGSRLANVVKAMLNVYFDIDVSDTDNFENQIS